MLCDNPKKKAEILADLLPHKVVPLKPPDAQAVKAQLLQNLQPLLHHLLPAGTVRGGKFIIGNVQGDKGDSLVVELHGAKAGLWHDFATGCGGDILDLWAAVKGFDRQKHFLSLLNDVQSSLGSGVSMRLSQQSKQHSQSYLGKPTAKWDYTDATGKLLAHVYRYDPAPNRKEFRPWDALRGVMKSPEIRPLYNQVSMNSENTIILVEGEKCADALISVGICATTAMNGAKAPVEKTDWSPLKGKKLIIWPDHDEPGQSYARHAASAAARAGAVSVEILKIPSDKPPKWDAADAIAEGLPVHDILRHWDRVVAKAPLPARDTIAMYSMAELQADKSPMPDDLIAPRVLTPGGILVFGGAPKVGKSDFLISMLAHMAAGLPFLGLSSLRPLRIFYLQAEVQYDYLRERVHSLHIIHEKLAGFEANFVITPQISLTLNEVGLERVAYSVKERFKDTPPDIIAIDPLRNVFDGGGIGGENDNDAMMFFLSQRMEELRRRINPRAGIIIAHHTKKIPKKQVEEDPFQAFSGAGSLRSYYTSGIILHRNDETRPERSLIFELRNGPEIPQKTIQRTINGWQELRQQDTAADAANLRRKDTLIRLIFTEAQFDRVYTANQFAERFENKSGLGSSRAIRERLNILAVRGDIKFFKNADAYDLPQPQRSRQGYLCVRDMALANGKCVLPTHAKHPKNGDIIPLERPDDWSGPLASFGEER